MANTMPNTSPKLLEGLHERLDEMSHKLFVDAEIDVEIPWRDLGVGFKHGTLNHSILIFYLLTYQILKRKTFTILLNWQR